MYGRPKYDKNDTSSIVFLPATRCQLVLMAAVVDCDLNGLLAKHSSSCMSDIHHDEKLGKSGCCDELLTGSLSCTAAYLLCLSP